MTYRSAIHDHRHPHGEDDSYRDHQDRDGNWNVRNRMVHRFLSTSLFRDSAGQRLPADRLYHNSAHAICPSKPSVFAMSRGVLQRLGATRSARCYGRHPTSANPGPDSQQDRRLDTSPSAVGYTVGDAETKIETLETRLFRDFFGASDRPGWWPGVLQLRRVRVGVGSVASGSGT